MSSKEGNDSSNPVTSLMSAMRQERNDAIASLAAARAELELLREHAGVGRGPSPVAQSPSGVSGDQEATDASLRASRAIVRQKEAAVEQLRQRFAERSMARRRSQSPNPTIDPTGLQVVVSPAVDEELEKQRFIANLARERRIDEEVATAMQRTKEHIQSVEQELNLRNSQLGHAIGRVSQLEAQLDEAQTASGRLAAQVAALQQQLSLERAAREAKAQECHALKMELQESLHGTSAHLDRIADLESTVERMGAASRAEVEAHAQQVRNLRARIGDLEVEIGLVKFNLERTNDDWRAKVTAISKELAGVREQRDKALTPYYAKPMDSVAITPPPPSSPMSPSPSYPSDLFHSSRGPVVVGTRRDIVSPGGPSGASPSLSYGGGVAPAAAAELHDLRKQVQWLTETVKLRGGLTATRQ